MMLLGFSDYRECAMRISSALAVPYAEISIHQFPDGESRNGRHVILIDDIASSGGTLMSAARACLAAGAAQVDAIAVHALFGDDVARQLRDSGIAHVWSTDSVVHPSNAISLAPLIASSLKAV
jgi:ribose-phosphate pyrophosphokinase